MPRRLPHLLIFVPDQWRGDVLGHLGNPAARTPFLDRLVREEAVSFRNAFCQSPVCTPSRCSFMTGWYPHVRGHRTMHHMLHPEQGENNLLRALKQSGYHVFWAGKNDLVPGQHGIEEHCTTYFQATPEHFRKWGLTPREGNHAGDMAWRGKPGGPDYYGFYKGRLDKGNDPVHASDDWPNIFGAIDFIRSYDGPDPLCIYLPLGLPHPPYCVEEPWFSAIDRTRLPRRIPPPTDPAAPAILRGLLERENLSGWPEEKWTELRAVYYGACMRADRQFEMVVEAMRERGFYDDTAVFFFSDHGGYSGDYGLAEKAQNLFHDCVARVPFVFRPPKGVPCQPGVRDALVELIDFPATVCALTGVELGHTHFGRSLLPLAAGTVMKHRDAVFCEGGRLRGEWHASERESDQSKTSLYWPRMSLQALDDPPYHTKAVMIRTHRYKYVRRLYERDELYDLQTDPDELVNRIDDPGMASVRHELQARLVTWYLETSDVVPYTPDSRWIGVGQPAEPGPGSAAVQHVNGSSPAVGSDCHR